MALSIDQQLAILLDQGVDRAGERHRLSEVAAATGIRYQTLAKLLNGQSSSPRLSTLLALCHFYDISLDYFACDTEAACRHYLELHHARLASPLIREIEHESARLTDQGQRNVLTIMDWMRAGQQS